MWAEIARRIEESDDIGRGTEVGLLMEDGEVSGAYSSPGEEVTELYLGIYDPEVDVFNSHARLEFWNDYRGMDNVVKHSRKEEAYSLEELKNTILYFGRKGGIVGLEDLRQELEEEISYLEF